MKTINRISAGAIWFGLACFGWCIHYSPPYIGDIFWWMRPQ